jgi:hypothetical protein
LLVILIAVNSLVHRYFLPFGWGDNVLYVKYRHYEEHKEDFNTLFLGGSLVYRHVDPHLLDSLTNANGLATSTYNLGVDGNGFVKCNMELDKILEDPSPELKYIFMSLSNSSIFLRLNLHTRKFVTWWRFRDVVYAIRLTWQLPMPARRKAKFTYFYAITFIENRLNFGHLTDAVQFHVKKEGYDASYLGVRQDGFYPYDHQAGRQLMSQAWEDTLMKISRQVYLTDTVRRKQMLVKNVAEFREFDENDPPVQLMIDTYMDMIRRCEEKGIKLVVLMPPRIREPYTYFIPIYNALPEANRINLASPMDYPEFWEVHNSYNFHHLDLYGAELYTTALAEEFLKIEGVDNDLYRSPELTDPYVIEATGAVPGR